MGDAGTISKPARASFLFGRTSGKGGKNGRDASRSARRTRRFRTAVFELG